MAAGADLQLDGEQPARAIITLPPRILLTRQPGHSPHREGPVAIRSPRSQPAKAVWSLPADPSRCPLLCGERDSVDAVAGGEFPACGVVLYSGNRAMIYSCLLLVTTEHSPHREGAWKVALRKSHKRPKRFGFSQEALYSQAPSRYGPGLSSGALIRYYTTPTSPTQALSAAS